MVRQRNGSFANLIEMTGSTIGSVRDVRIQTGQEDYTTVAYATTQYLYTTGVGKDVFIGDAEFSLKESTGKVKTNNSNTITLGANNKLEAGIHWDTYVTIKADGTIDQSKWLNVAENKTRDKNMLELFEKQIKSLQEKQTLASAFSSTEAAA